MIKEYIIRFTPPFHPNRLNYHFTPSRLSLTLSHVDHPCILLFLPSIPPFVSIPCTPIIAQKKAPTPLIPMTSSVTPVLSSIIQTTPIDHIEYSTRDTIAYHPSSDLIRFDWTSAWAILAHLLIQPEDRKALRMEAQRRSPSHPTSYPIHHGHLRGELTINSFEVDYTFILKIEALMSRIERQTRVGPLTHKIITYEDAASYLWYSPDHSYQGSGLALSQHHVQQFTNRA